MLSRPYRALVVVFAIIPRALPWAFMSRPSGAGADVVGTGCPKAFIGSEISVNPTQPFDAKIQSYKESEHDYQIEDPIVIPIGKFGDAPSRWEYAFLPTIVDDAPQNE